MDIMILVAIYGAILSTILGIIKIIQTYKDKPKLIVKYSTGISPSDKGFKPVFLITASNRTKHRLVFQSLGICLKNNLTIYPIHNMGTLPKELLSGDSHSIVMNIEEIAKALKNNGDAKYIFVKDATGREYRGSGKKMKRKVLALINSFSNLNK